MKIIYNDNIDGLCASSIISTEFSNPFAPMSTDDFISGKYHIPEDIKIGANETVYIIGIELNKASYEIISKLINMDCHIIHIDNHKSSQSFYNDTISSIDNNYYKHLFRDDGCNTLLTWVYVNMNDEEKYNCHDIHIDFEYNWNHFVIDSREYVNPPVIRYINDKTMHLNYFSETNNFIKGISIEDLSPKSIIWSQLIYNWNSSIISNYINKGQIINQYLKVFFTDCVNRSFSHVLENSSNSVLCVNSVIDDPDLFSDIIKPMKEDDAGIDHYDIGCIYSYNGRLDIWEFSLYTYSDEINMVEWARNCLTENVYIYGDEDTAFVGLKYPFVV